MPKASKKQELEDGWTRICRGKKVVHHPNRGTHEPAKDATTASLTADFERKKRTWQRSSCRASFHHFLDREEPEDGWQITKAMCLASGSFSRDNWECSKRSMFQLVAFIDATEHLHASATNRLRLLAQDPMYDSLDREFLSTLNIDVIEITWDDAYHHDLHLAKEQIGSDTLVFEFFMEMGPKPMRDLLDSDMQIYIGASFHEKLAAHYGIDGSRKESDVAQQFKEKYQSRRFPRFEEDPHVFEGLMIHWKEPKDEDE